MNENETTVPANESPEVTPLVAEWSTILQAIQQLQENFEAKIKYDASKERMVDTLHQELQAYREGLHFKILRPIFMDLITMYDDFTKILSVISPDDNPPQTLLSFQDTLAGILEKHGVEIYCEEGDTLMAKRQQVVKTSPTNDSEKDKLVATRLYKGFSFEDRILRPERVTTFKYQAEVSHEPA